MLRPVSNGLSAPDSEPEREIERQREIERPIVPAFDEDVAVVGGCGHVGLPLGLAFADSGLRVTLYDVNADAVEKVSAGKMPFRETGAAEVLERVIDKNLTATTDPNAISSAEHVIVVIGTPADEHLSLNPSVVARSVETIGGHLVSGQLIVLRSTVYPGTTRVVESVISRLGVALDISFCPERIAEGNAMIELHELPQLIAARSEEVFARAEKLFGNLTERMVRLTPEEAELAKLFTNTWRYIKFATANQLYIFANDFGLDYEQIRAALAFDYPRAADLPKAGFAAGPCLLKDTMQLATFSNNNFALGHTAMMINEGLPLYVVSKLETAYPLADMVVGVLGMAFKEGSDDIRSSLSYKLKNILRFKAKDVLCSDPFVTVDPELVPLENLLALADILIVATPHPEYRNLDTSLPIVDIWGSQGRGVRV